MRVTVAGVTPEEVVARLAPYAPTFHECLRAAVADARQRLFGYGDSGAPFEPWLFANCVRWQLKQRLAAALPPGTPVVVEGDTIMSSVVVHFEDLEIRFRKSEPGEVPVPGSSGRMRAWYAQTLDGSVSHNILLLWHVDERLDYTGLSVAFPYGGTAHAPLVHWVVPLPVDAGEPQDLDITLPDVAERGADGRQAGPS